MVMILYGFWGTANPSWIAQTRVLCYNFDKTESKDIMDSSFHLHLAVLRSPMCRSRETTWEGVGSPPTEPSAVAPLCSARVGTSCCQHGLLPRVGTRPYPGFQLMLPPVLHGSSSALCHTQTHGHTVIHQQPSSSARVLSRVQGSDVQGEPASWGFQHNRASAETIPSTIDEPLQLGPAA